MVPSPRKQKAKQDTLPSSGHSRGLGITGFTILNSCGGIQELSEDLDKELYIRPDRLLVLTFFASQFHTRQL